MIKSKLRDLLWQKDIKQKELAKATGISEETISNLIRDKDCKLSTIDKICNFLDCDITDVIEFKK